MTKTEWTDILAYYKQMFQLEQLPDADYLVAMYNELSHYDPRFIAYAVKRIIATETTTYNRYPLLSQIYANLPDLSWQKREIEEKKSELEKLLEEKLRPNHWYYPIQQQRIKTLTAYFTGTPKTAITSAELEKAKESKMQHYINEFFGAPKTKLIG